ncbi:pyridoxal-phosphate dependent enzyme [Streptomyces sp. NPDC058122]|uniref:pyridoxal-phosphate dependent enzyme n=1 Tax=Streptomyces sp. NPDC058122 TaxID=3346349 RepID=UPI0036EA7B73
MARQYLGQPLPARVLPEQPVAGTAIRYLTAQPGRVVSVGGQERAAALPGVEEVVLKVRPGDEVRELRRNGDRAGHVLVVAETAQLAARTAEAAAKEIGIRTEPVVRRPVADSLVELIGGTPLLRLPLDRILDGVPGDTSVLAKLELFNPWSSSKDRAALSMLRGAEGRGQLTPGDGTVIEATSGNTGISLAALAAARGYRCVIVLPDNATQERVSILLSLGAEVVRTPHTGGYQAAVDKAEEIHLTTPGSWFCRQHENPDNTRAHYESTGPEIWSDTQGQVDVFVSGVGTGGTLSGAGRYLRERHPAVRLVAVEPAGSPLLSGGEPGTHGIPGFNGGFVAPTTERELIDEVIAVSDSDALDTTRRLALRAGLMVGVSAGAVVHAAGVVAARPENRGKRVVTLLPDTGERYLSLLGRATEPATAEPATAGAAGGGGAR